MAWLNLVSFRTRRARILKDVLDDPTLLDSFGTILPAARAAIELGDLESLQRITRETRPLYADFQTRAVAPGQQQTFDLVGTSISISCLYAVAGENQKSFWARIRKLAPREPAIDALFRILLEGHEAPSTKRRAKAMRYPRTLAAFSKDLDVRSTAELLDIVNSPDHPSYPGWMQYWVFPLALLRAAETDAPALVPVSMGAFPDRRGELLYARTRRRPAHLVEPVKDGPKTWFDFDALERKGDELRVFHYVGISWKAPLAFEGNLDGFSFLKSLAYDWATVERTVSRETWAWIVAARAAGRCTHVVAYDPTEAGASDGAVAAASAHYGVTLTAESLFDV